MPYITTFSGNAFAFDFNNPPDYFNVTEIGTVLSRICRFAGHTRWHYSVAQHSVLCQKLVPKELELPALLHDVAEVWIGDITRPLKAFIRKESEAVAKLEQFIQKWIAEIHGFDQGLLECEEVKRADAIALSTEMRDLQGVTACADMLEPLKNRIVPWDRDFARDEWIARYNALR